MSKMTKEESRQYHEDEDRAEKARETELAYFDAFVESNEDDLKKEFLEMFESEFHEYCWEQFKQFGRD
jgi:hypothetical protein